MVTFQAAQPLLTRFSASLPLTANTAPFAPAQAFGPAQDTVHFSGKTPEKPAPTVMPYDVEAPTSADRHSLGVAGELSEYIGDLLDKKYLANGAGLEKALKAYDDVKHPLTQEDFRRKFAPVLDLYRQMGAQGYMGVNVPEQYGGAEAGTLATIELARQLAYADLGACTTILASVGLFGEPVLDLGTEAQKMKYVVPVLAGDKIGAFGLTEPDAGSDPGSVRTTAKASIGPDGKRTWKLNGTKTFISNGNTADYAVIVAKTIDETGKDRGLSGFIVERGDVGFTSADVGKKMGLHTSDTAELSLDDVVIAEDRLIGEESGIGQGKRIYNETLTGGRIGVGAQGIGVAQRAQDMAVEYAKQRKQGGGNVIANYPEIRELIARTEVRNDAALALAYHAARTKDAGLPFAKHAAMTKLFATEFASKEATDASIQIHGGMGFMEETGVAKLARDARVLRIYEGTSQIQKMIIASQILGEVMSGNVPQIEGNPKNVFEVVDKAFAQAIEAAQPEIVKEFTALGHPLKALNAAQSVGYRLALIATEREALLALKAHVETLEKANVPHEKEAAELRLFAGDVAKRALDLANEVGVPAKSDLRRLASVRSMVDHPATSVRDDLEVVAAASGPANSSAPSKAKHQTQRARGIPSGSF